MAEPVIALRGVTRTYDRGSETVRALDGLDLEVPGRAFCAIMGPSGSGKSTFLHLVGGLDHPQEGTVHVAGRDLGALSSGALARFRSETIGFVFQGFNLIPVLSALENVELPLLLTPLGRAERRKHALYALELVGVADRAHHRPRELSGGQEQRVAIARAIATDPQIILADEPTGDLDRKAGDQVLELLEKLHAELGKTVVMVTHDPRAAERAERVVHLDKGKLERVEVRGGGADPAVAAAGAGSGPGAVRTEA